MTSSLRHAHLLFAAVFVLMAGSARANLNFAIEMNPDTVRPGEPVNVELTVANPDATVASGIVINAIVPSNVFSFPDSTRPTTRVLGNATCPGTATSNCDPGETITWTLSNLPPGGSVKVAAWPVITTSPAPPADGTEIIFDATLSHDGASDQNVVQSVFVDSDAAFELALDEDLDPVRDGSLLTYDLVYGNRSVDSVTDTTLTLPLPAGVTFMSATGGGTESGGTVSWNLGTVGAGTADRQQVQVMVNSLSNGALLPIDSATISGTNGNTFFPETANAQTVTRYTGAAGLGLALEMNPDPVRDGERNRFEITFANQTAGLLSDVVLNVIVPNNLLSFPDSTRGTSRMTEDGTCPGTATSNCDTDELISWSFPSLAAGASKTVAAWSNLPASAAVDDGQLIKLDTFVSATGGRQSTASYTTAAETDNALELGLDENLDPVQVGDTLRYDLTFGNRSINSVTNTSLRFDLPQGVTFDAASGNGSESGGVVTWTLGTVLANQHGTEWVTVTVDSVANGTLLPVDYATISGTNGLTGLTENSNATAVTRVTGSEQLALALATNPDPARPGERIRNELTLGNVSGGPLFDIELTAAVPPDLNSFPDSTRGTSRVTGDALCNGTATSNCDRNEQIRWSLASLADGESTTVSFYTDVDPSPVPPDGKLLKLDAQATATGDALVMASKTAAVDGAGPWSLSIWDAADPSLPDDTIQYAIKFGNRSGSSLTDNLLLVPLPEGTELVGSSGGTEFNFGPYGKTVSFDINTIAAGGGGVRKLAIRGVSSLRNGLPVELPGVEISGLPGGLPPFEVARGTEITRVSVTRPLDLNVTLTPNPVSQGETFTAMYDITNNSGSSVSDVVLKTEIGESAGSFADSTRAVPEVSAPGICNGVATSNCDSGEQITFDFGTLTPGQTVSVTATTDLVLSPANGRLLPWNADLRADGGVETQAQDTFLVGTFSDSDSDGIANLFDNCINAGNSDQTDTNFDGFGNLCDADVNGDGVVDFGDLPAFQAAFFSQEGDLNYNPDADLNNDGVVDFADLPIIQQQFFGAPGPSGPVELP